MKKIIVAAAIILTAGALTVFNKDNNVKTVAMAKTNVAFDKNVLGTAD